MRTLLAIALGALSLSLNAQIIKDSITTGPNNENQIWYNLNKGTVGTKPLADWHLGFEISGITSSILINSASGHELYSYANGDTSDWEKMDTTGLHTWKGLYNADSSWAFGAFNQHLDTKNEFDLGWGAYNITNHWVVGDSLYLLKMASGSWKKLWIEKLAGGAYDFKYADLDGTNEKMGSVSKAQFSGKNFGYFNLEKDEVIDLEPLADDWDLLFTKYTTLIPVGPNAVLPYGVSGVLTNAGTAVTKLYPIDDPETFKDHEKANNRSSINQIGYGWKKFDFPTSTYQIEDSTVYLVKKPNGAIWKVVMTGYGGTATGQINFYKELLDATGTSEIASGKNGLFVYPSFVPQGQIVTVTSSLNTDRATLSLVSIDGKVVWQNEITESLETAYLPTAKLQKGLYILQLADRETRTTQKLIVR